MASVVEPGGVCVWQESRVRSQVVGFVLVSLAVAMKMFSRVIYLVKKVHKCYTFNTICKDNVAIHCITLQQNKGLFPSNLTCHTLC
jgi:hypothetical protein